MHSNIIKHHFFCWTNWRRLVFRVVASLLKPGGQLLYRYDYRYASIKRRPERRHFTQSKKVPMGQHTQLLIFGIRDHPFFRRVAILTHSPHTPPKRKVIAQTLKKGKPAITAQHYIDPHSWQLCIHTCLAIIFRFGHFPSTWIAAASAWISLPLKSHLVRWVSLLKSSTHLWVISSHPALIIP